MPIFSKVKNAKKAADQHKRASKTQAETKSTPAPYRHVPTHAAQDSLSCAPHRWSAQETRQKIAAAHQQKRFNMSNKAVSYSRDSVIASKGHKIYQPRSPYHYNGPAPPVMNSHVGRLANATPIMPALVPRSPLSSTFTEVEEETLQMPPPICATTKGLPQQTHAMDFNQKPPQSTNFSRKSHIVNELVLPPPKRDVARQTTPPLPATSTKVPKRRNWFRKRQQIVAK
ncbi:uncharacterized protein BDZ99DRAFT_502844 [Mytilinidion resinicola]|uniref:Uncharacterized protein n=1 Tax=Mytilinidion resinicola TaxID=574789 RepID=A0A6A6Y5W6_9PEZI|nr:uncharacterized protein BDZ99DRAFT_502844 [Mytilinidion resinicola]KAF2804019.1 hypothetical protein BDZ99DRAFT_502844 [Mytilinidion resinicola]